VRLIALVPAGFGLRFKFFLTEEDGDALPQTLAGKQLQH
jgi:hypothetical protein